MLSVTEAYDATAEDVAQLIEDGAVDVMHVITRADWKVVTDHDVAPNCLPAATPYVGSIAF